MFAWLVRLPVGGPALLTFTADASSFFALSGQHVEVAGVGVAPSQACLDSADEHGAVGVAEVAHRDCAQRSELGFDRVGPGGVGRGEAELDVVAFGPPSDSRVVFPVGARAGRGRSFRMALDRVGQYVRGLARWNRSVRGPPRPPVRRDLCAVNHARLGAVAVTGRSLDWLH